MNDLNEANTELTTLIPTVSIIALHGVEIRIEPFKMGQLPHVLAAIAPIKNIFSLGEQHGENLDVTSLFMLHADECLNLLSVLANQPRSFINQLSLDEGFDLFSQLLGVNADFFVQRVLPVITQMIRNIAQHLSANQALTPLDGQINSNA